MNNSISALRLFEFGRIIEKYKLIFNGYCIETHLSYLKNLLEF